MLKRFSLLLFVLAISVAGIRFVRVASVCELGWSSVVTEWQNTLGFIGLGHTPVGHLPPPKQADYWTNEVDRVVRGTPNSATIEMGAAWVLDSPGMGFLESHFRQTDFAQAFPQFGMELDEEAIANEKTAFRRRCLDKCLQLAEQATADDPDDVRWWRLRALLLFEGDTLYSGKEFEPRTEDWIQVLDQCKAHDPQNALYDYLAALQLWNTSATYDLPPEPLEQSPSDEAVNPGSNEDIDDPTAEDANDLWILTVHDSTGFSLGVDRFLDAQQLPFLAIGEEGYSSITEFLANSSIRKSDQAEIALSRLVNFRHSTLFHRLWLWQAARADDARRASDHKGTLTCLQQNLRLCEQSIVPEETSALSTLSTFGVLRQSTYDAVENLAESHPQLLDESELASIRRREEELRVEASSLISALQTLEAESSTFESWPALVSMVTCTSVVTLLVTATVFVLLARLISRHREPGRIGLLRQALAWATGCGVTLVILGMAPAEMVSHDTQKFAAKVGVCFVAAVTTSAAVLFVIRMLRQRKIRFRLISLLAVMTGVAVLASLWPLMEASFARIAQHSPELWLPARGWNGIDAEVLRTASNIEKGSWRWASLQWFAHGGPYVGLLVSLLLATLWFSWRTARQAGQSLVNYWTQDIKTKWPRLSAFTGRAALAAALCWGFLYLCIAPYAIRTTEDQFQYQMRYCRDPHARWAEIRAAQAVVLNSPGEIDAIREQVHFDLYGEDFLEQDYSSN